MSNTSRRRVTKSRRRVAMAAGVILAGVATPIAAAGTAWADTAAQEAADAAAAVSEARAYAKAGVPVDVSVNGKPVKGLDTCETCAATSGKGDVAVAIGPYASAIDSSTGDKHDLAIATNGGTAVINDATVGVATAAAGSTAEINLTTVPATPSTGDVATATGVGTVADVESANGSTATATDTTSGGGAFISYATGSFATATGDGSTAQVAGISPSAEVTASSAIADTDGTAQVINDGKAPAGITVTGDLAAATAASTARVLDSQNSSLTATDGSFHSITGQNGQTVVNVVPGEMTPLADVHEMHVLPSVPLP
jgi:hypothetical protein